MSHKRAHFILNLLLTSIVLFTLILLAGRARPALAAPDDAGCGDVVINEIKFKQNSGTSGVDSDEWVELYVINDLPANTVLELDDMEGDRLTETSHSGWFYKKFTLGPVASGSYIVVHANPSGSSESPTAGDINIFEAEADGNPGNSAVMGNSNDNTVLYVNGAACEEVHWGQGSSSVAAIEYDYGNPSSGSTKVENGESIQRNPNGTGTDFLPGSNSAFADVTTIGYNNNGDPTLVELVSFAATAHGDNVLLTWETGAEIDTAGFNLYRADSVSGPQVRVNEQLLAARGEGMGASYAYEEKTVGQGVRFYWLEDVDYAGVRTLHGPIQVEVGDAGGENDRSIFLPIVSSQ